MRITKKFFQENLPLKENNHTFIVLIPKVKNPNRVDHYRPISLSNVIYKIIAKTLANRLNKVLNELISPSHNAFLEGRQISNNILIAHEVFHHMIRSKNNFPDMAIKINMSKENDRVEWDFFLEMMQKMGFNLKWVGWIRECISSVTFQLLINGSSSKYFEPKKSLR